MLNRDNINLLARSALFHGIDAGDLPKMLDCLTATERDYAKDACIYRIGDRTTQMAVVVSGRILISREDFWGNRSILTEVGPGGLFGETYACIAGEPLMVNAVAAEQSRVLFLDVQKVLQTCTASCVFHSRLIANLTQVLAQKNLILAAKMELLMQRTTRQKLLSYLSAEAQRQGGGDFTIPFDRQQLADYLSVDRSAMSNELGKLRRAGILETSRNRFRLLLERPDDHH